MHQSGELLKQLKQIGALH
ncbi:unnamed protein product [Gulo gulo]|uniref:Uncharacterized protein n=1 Tax=Gulo gulo TaxID=48420 RepID=A0A9X9M0H7_GULGU|nr:unnamed protein product [Gulo gulo]